MSTAEARAPLHASRRAQLLETLHRDGTVRVSELSDRLGVAAVTVRRDIAQLAREGLVRRVHGGATLITSVEQSDPNNVPHGKVATRVGTIGMLVPSLTYYWPTVARGAEEAGSAQSLRVVLRESSYESDDDRTQLERLLPPGGGVDGLIVAPRLDVPTADETLSWLAGTGLPVVLVERTASVGPHHAVLESVVSDHELGSAMAVGHLAELGHRRIGLMANQFSPHSTHIREGWQAALVDNGLDSTTTVDATVPPTSASGRMGVLDGIIEECLRTQTTALLVHADAEAMALVQRAEEHGISVPGDLSIVAYDDEVAGMFSPPLTAVRAPRLSIGRAAVDLIAARLSDPERPTHRVVISPTLSVRESSAPPRTD